jgi:hypothetical protein
VHHHTWPTNMYVFWKNALNPFWKQVGIKSQSNIVIHDFKNHKLMICDMSLNL